MSATAFTKRLRYLVDTLHGGNVKEAARQSGVPQPTLHALYAGTATAPRRKTLEKLTRFYTVSEDWLLGRTGGLRNPDLAVPRETPAGLPPRLEGGGWVELLPLGDRALYYWRRFEGMCYSAWERDRVKTKSVPDWRELWLCMRVLVTGAFERRLIKGKRGERFPKLSRLEYDEVIPARVRQLEVLLGPWFKGRRALNYPRLRKWVHMVVEGEFSAADRERNLPTSTASQ